MNDNIVLELTERAHKAEQENMRLKREIEQLRKMIPPGVMTVTLGSRGSDGIRSKVVDPLVKTSESKP